MFRSQQIIICTSLKLLNYLKKNTEFKILTINPGVVATIHVASVRGVTTYTCYTYCYHNTEIDR